MAGPGEPTREQIEDEPGAAQREAAVGGKLPTAPAGLSGAAEAAGQSPSVRAAVESLQRAAGNRYVSGRVQTRVLARLRKSYARLDPVAAVARALNDEEEDDALELMRALTTADQANAVLHTYQRAAVKTFGNKTMGQAMAILVAKGGHLREALSWMDDEGTNWSLQSNVIRQASMDERKWIMTPDWRRYWIKELGNKEIAALVKLLPLSLADRIEWMHEEGTDGALLKDVINASPAAERAPLMNSDRMRAIFLDECSKHELYEAVALLGGPLKLQLSWMAQRGCDDEWIWERVKAISDPQQRLAVYGERPAWLRLLRMSKQDRAEIAITLGGGPDQLLSLFQRDVPIAWLNRIPGGKAPSAAWVDALIKYRSKSDSAGNPTVIDANDVLWIGSGNPTAWAPFLGPRLNDILSKFHDTIAPEFNVKVFWAAYDKMPPAAATAKELMHMVGVLTGVEPFLPGRSGKVPHRDFLATDPNLATAREFMDILKPGGPSGATGISREQLAKGKLAFIYWDTSTDPGKAVDTSYFSDPWILIQVDANGARSTNMISSIGSDPALAAGPTPRTWGTTLTYFQNHVRHEIGHAVGNNKVGNMRISGNDFAIGYGGWKKSSKKTFRNALWTDVAEPRGGWPTLVIAGQRVKVSNDDARDWCMTIMDDGKEPNNSLGSGTPGTVQQKLQALKGSLWSANRLVAYMIAIGETKPSDERDSAYQFPGFTPDDPVQIFSTRWDNDFVSYDRDAHNNFMGISWYALSSPFEMFAEMYTVYYSKGVLPARRGRWDPQAFFNELENQHDPNFGT